MRESEIFLLGEFSLWQVTDLWCFRPRDTVPLRLLACDKAASHIQNNELSTWHRLLVPEMGLGQNSAMNLFLQIYLFFCLSGITESVPIRALRTKPSQTKDVHSFENWKKRTSGPIQISKEQSNQSINQSSITILPSFLPSPVNGTSPFPSFRPCHLPSVRPAGSSPESWAMAALREQVWEGKLCIRCLGLFHMSVPRSNRPAPEAPCPPCSTRRAQPTGQGALSCASLSRLTTAHEDPGCSQAPGLHLRRRSLLAHPWGGRPSALSYP